MLIVVRHGRTASNAAGLLLGRADPPLDEVGEAQARALAAAVGPVDRLVCSPLRRCRATAAAWGAPVEVDDRWIELDYGEFDQQPVAEVPQAVWVRWRADTAFAPPGGESLDDLAQRVRPALDELAETARTATVVVVTHVSPMKAAVAWALGVGIEVSWRTYVAPASITRIAIGDFGPSLAGFNDTAHL